MRFVLLSAAAWLFATAANAQTIKGTEYHLNDGPRADPALTAAILEVDNALFDAAFSTCDADKVAPMLTDDVRFVHDKWGQIAASKAQLVAVLRDGCARRASGVDFRSRRELVPESVEIYRLTGFGALEVGTHRFYALIPGKPEQLTETGRFMILWRQIDGAWKVAETISYSHELVPQ